MTRGLIEKALEAVEYTVHGGSYAVVDMRDEGVEYALSGIAVEHIAMGLNEACISLDSPYDDEADVADSLAYCGLYTGQ